MSVKSGPISLMDRTEDTWFQPAAEVDSWDIVGLDYKSGWRRREIELAWGPVLEIVEAKS